NPDKRFVNDSEKLKWNSMETPEGAQTKVNEHANSRNNPHRVTAEQVGAAPLSRYETHINNTTKHITPAERRKWNDAKRTRQIFVQSGTPSGAQVGDLWIW